MAKLVVYEGQLMLERAGQLSVPEANDVFRSIIEGEQVWPDISPGRNSAPKGLAFSRFPASAKLVLEKGVKDSTPTLRVAYFANSTELAYCAADGAVAGHVIDGNRWYPVDSVSKRAVENTLQDLDVRVGKIQSLKTYLKVRKRAAAEYYFEDRTASEIISPLTFSPQRQLVPKGINALLYPYQIDGWNWLRFIAGEHLGGLLADEMGLGKTLQVICALSDPGEIDLFPALIVAPGSLLENWSREFKRFCSHLKPHIHHGPTRTGNPDELKRHNIVITTYDTAVRDNSLMLMVSWGIVALDEAQNIKNSKARRSIAVKKLTRKVGLAITGTPVENRLTDLWSIIDFVMPGYLGRERDFVSSFPNDSGGAASLEPAISPIILRRTVEAVADDLPARINIPQAIRLEPSEAAAYERVRMEIAAKYAQGASLVALSRLRMFCSHPLIAAEWSDGDVSSLDLLNFSKFQRLDEIIDEIVTCREKVLVFSSFTKMADLIAEYVMRKYRIFVGRLDGRLPINKRQSLIDEFSMCSGSALLVLNPRAGGSGLNISAANHVIHYNLEWNPALEDQASARSYRRGQTRPVTVHRLFIADTVEEIIDERLTRKRELSQSAVVGVTGDEGDYEDIVAALQRSPVQTSSDN